MPTVVENITEAFRVQVGTIGGIAAVTRDAPEFLEGEAPPLVFVTALEEGFERLTLESDEVTYSLFAILVQQRIAKVRADGTARAWRQSVRRRVSDHNTIAVPEVWGCRLLRRGNPFDRAALRTDLWYTTIGVEYWTTEPRG